MNQLTHRYRSARPIRTGLSPALAWACRSQSTQSAPDGLNGVPIGAVVGSEDVMARFGRDIRYLNTFGGNPVSIAAATAALDGLGELADRHPAIGGVRGSGHFTALAFVDADRDCPNAAKASRVVNELRDRRILISASGPHENVLKIRPPLPRTTDYADRLLSELDDVLTQTRE